MSKRQLIVSDNRTGGSSNLRGEEWIGRPTRKSEAREGLAGKGECSSPAKGECHGLWEWETQGPDIQSSGWAHGKDSDF